MTVDQIDVSVVIPVYNEAESLEQLYEELSQTLSGLGRPYELLFVDDGSRDGSFERLARLHESNRRVRCIQLRRNFGKSAALSTGFAGTRGEIVVTLDADLQDDPAEIPKLLAKLEEGYDLVSGWKADRQDALTKTLPSRFFNFVTSRVTRVGLHDFNCGLKAYTRELVDELELYGEMHRYIPVLASGKGFAVSEVSVNHRPREHGQSKFGVERMLSGFFDLLTVLFLTHYEWRPLHLMGLGGLASLGLGVVILAYLSVLWLQGVRPIGNRPLLTLGVLLVIVGVQFFTMGLLAELLVKSYGGKESKVSIKCTLPTEAREAVAGSTRDE